MKNTVIEKNEEVVGVAVVRCSVIDLHKGHLHLLRHIIDRHRHVLIAVGTTGAMPNVKNFLPFDMRKEMLQKQFPSITVVEMRDHPIDAKAWSRELDKLVKQSFPGKTAIAYGSRDSFLKNYFGRMKVVEVPPLGNFSGTKQREAISIPNNRYVRMGMLKAAQIRFPISFATVDLAILSKNKRKVILVGRKRELGKLRFPGGFADVEDDSYEDSAIREGKEEVPKVIFRKVRYIGSKRIDDRRYRGSPDGIKTLFFTAKHVRGKPKAGDDVDTAEWVLIKHLKKKLVASHQPLGEMLVAHLRERAKKKSNKKTKKK